MIWIKQGLIYAPNQAHSWNQSHATIPTVDAVNDQIWRIYYASRDELNRSHTSYIEVEAGNPKHILYEHDKPILPLGKIGAFDDCGIMPSWIVSHHHRKYLFYIGWCVRNTVPYHNSIGLAISEDGGRTFEKISEGPLFGSTPWEPYFTGTSCVVIEGDMWKMWYMSCTKWEVIDGKPEPFYHLKYAESNDGINWQRRNLVAIDYQSEMEAGIARASVIRESGIYKMWYCHRCGGGYRTDKQASYRIGYAESLDGIHWSRMDEKVGIDVSESGWDSEMIAYPFVVAHHGQKYLFYNGNAFGKSGFGYATSSSSN